MRAIAAGDRDAFRTLVDRHAPKLTALARRTLGATSDAEDVVQEALLRVWRHADRFQPGRAQVSTWMHRIVLNLCLDRIRARPDDAPGPICDMPAECGDAACQLQQRQVRDAVGEALARLPARQRAAVALFHYQELSGRESAAVLGLSESAFESLLLRARKALRHRLAALLDSVKEPP